MSFTESLKGGQRHDGIAHPIGGPDQDGLKLFQLAGTRSLRIVIAAEAVAVVNRVPSWPKPAWSRAARCIKAHAALVTAMAALPSGIVSGLRRAREWAGRARNCCVWLPIRFVRWSRGFVPSRYRCTG